MALGDMIGTWYQAAQQRRWSASLCFRRSNTSVCRAHRVCVYSRAETPRSRGRRCSLWCAPHLRIEPGLFDVRRVRREGLFTANRASKGPEKGDQTGVSEEHDPSLSHQKA